ncbi:MAG: amino acid ABC transporter ATP-binding protein [Desulfuromonas sp.]|nr:amino acid ABC transporter ATP-binding protein [Desulfuromonas sp.]
MISIRNLAKRFGSVEVLHSINAEIKKGEVVSIIGSSGTGKSTLLRCLNLLEQPSAGSILIDGQEITAPGANVPRLRQRMGMVFQSFNLFPHLDVLGNLTLGPIHLLGHKPATATAKAMELLSMVGLAEKSHSFPAELSGGQQQRVAIARCLSMEPDIILFDEPTSALDPTMVSEVLAVIRRLAQGGMTMAIVTHEMEFARQVSTRVFYLDEGIIYEQGPPEQIFANPQNQRTRDFIQQIRRLELNLTSRNFDLYAIFGQLEQFCQKHLLPSGVVNRVQLLTEETLELLKLGVEPFDVQFSVAHHEKDAALELCFASVGPPGNPLEAEDLEDNLGAILIRNLAREVRYECSVGRSTERNMLTLWLDLN